VKKISGTIAVLSGIEIETEEGGGGGLQGGDAQISRSFYLERIHPNPAKGMIKIRFNSPDERKITIKLYDVCGRLVLLKSRIRVNEVLIKPECLPTGVYFVQLEADGYTKTEKVILLK
jgi:hypothetical protein